MIRKKSSFRGVLTSNIVIKEKVGLDGKSITYVFNPDYVKLCRYALDHNDISIMNEEQKKFFDEYTKAMDKKLKDNIIDDTELKETDIYSQFDEYLGSSRG